MSIKKVEKLSKYMYKDLEIEVTKMWGMKSSTVPIVDIGALGLIKKALINRSISFFAVLVWENSRK